MGLLILGKNMLGTRGNAQYRGTYRESIPHADEQAEDSEYNVLFDWYVNEEVLGVVGDLSRTRRLLALLHDELGRPEFELVEAIPEGEPQQTEDGFLGYDLGHRLSYSLLSWGLAFEGIDQRGVLSPAIRDLLALVESRFKPALNTNGLFTSRETATFCLRCMMALQALSPGLWEDEESSKSEVVAIMKVPDMG